MIRNCNNRKAEKIFLICLAIFGVIYSFEFGLQLSSYGHGGQLLGVPFAIMLIIYCSVIIFSKSAKRRRVFRIINYTYVTSMTLYSLTIFIIKSNKKETAWDYLYLFNVPDLTRSEKIFNGYAIGGLSVCIILLIINWRRQLKLKEQ